MQVKSSRSVRARPVLAVFAALLLFAGACGSGENAAEVTAAAETTAAAAEVGATPETTPAEVGATPETTPTEVGATAETTAGTEPAENVPPPADYPLRITTPSGDDLTIASRPERIVSLSPTHTEMLFAIGAGEQVVAVDEYSYYPPEAPVTELSGFNPNLEAIADYQPDFVVSSYVPGDLAEGMETLGIPMLVLSAAEEIFDVYDQMRLLGKVTANVAGAEELVSSMQARFAELLQGIAPDLEATYYHELDSTFYSVTSDTFIGSVYALAGLRSIADEAEDAGGYPQLSAEFILESDPDLIFVSSGTPEETLAEVAERPGWSQLTAVQEGAVVVLPPDIASRWGPRIVDFLEFVTDALADMS